MPPDIIFEKNMTDQKGGGYFETARYNYSPSIT
eukprot:UN02712